MATKAKKQPAAIDGAAKEKQEKNRARNILSSSVNAAAVIESYSSAVFGEHQPGDLRHIYDELSAAVVNVWDGDMRQCEAMLMAQAWALQSIFTNLTRRAITQDRLAQFDTHLRLGLKAQAQAARTIEVLAEMKNPRSVAFVKQANIANNQQVNNGQVSRAGENENEQTKQAGATYELLPDTRASQADGRVNPALEAVGAKHRANDRSGQNEGGTEPLQGR